MVIVKFVVDSLPYATGNLAGFPAMKAAELVRDGRAVYCDETGKEIFDYAVVLDDGEKKAAEAAVEETAPEEKEEEKSPTPAPSRFRRMSNDKTDKNG